MGSELLESILDGCRNHMTELSVIWDYIGFEDDERERRIKQIANDLKLLLDNKIATENQLRLEIESEIENKKREVTQLCQQLKITTFFPPRDLSSYHLLKILKEKTKELQDIKAERQGLFISIYKDIVQLQTLLSIDEKSKECETLRENICFQGNSSNHDIQIKDQYIPTEEDLETHRLYFISLKNNYNDILQKYNNFLQDVGRIAADIEYTGESDFERQIFERFDQLDTNEKKEIDFSKAEIIDNNLLDEMQKLRLKLVKRKAMLLSTCEELRSYLLSMWYRLHIDEESKKELMQQCSGYKPEVLEILQEEVSKCQQMKWEQIGVYYSGLIDDKDEIEKKLLMNSNKERDYSIDNLTEETVSSLEQEIDHLKEKYERHQPLYDTVANYQNLWLSYIDVERQMKDPNILSNRGGILLKTEKEKKRLLRELPKCEAMVTEAITQYELTSRTKFFVWNNLSFKDYVEHLWLEFRGHKETSKYRRPGSGAQSVSSSPKRNSVARVK